MYPPAAWWVSFHTLADLLSGAGKHPNGCLALEQAGRHGLPGLSFGSIAQRSIQSGFKADRWPAVNWEQVAIRSWDGIALGRALDARRVLSC